MYHPQQLQQCSSPLSLNSLTGIAFGSSGLVSNHCTPWKGCLFVGKYAHEAVQTVRPPYLQNTQDFGWAGITFFLDHRSYSATFTFLKEIYCSHQMCFSFKISSAPKEAFLWGGPIKLNFFLSLPYSLLLDYSTLRSLPYPTLLKVEKPLLVGACP